MGYEDPSHHQRQPVDLHSVTAVFFAVSLSETGGARAFGSAKYTEAIDSKMIFQPEEIISHFSDSVLKE